ncbi:excinuclease ABC subunit UvrA [Aquisalimonas sp.]|uniref:excinuclease ABC subunit UvrA n=1 Tax=Aquisalimonas sp. TaxID=1872621 RepID=UPI0025BA40ED|nr:excinuclease ABC subunit UvrA [Aquisalimonas sp.]
MEHIRIRGARTHNLRDIDLDLPRNQLVVITGVSGSGKSSLAFDTIYAEGQRRYVESLSAYARQFLSIMEKPDVDEIQGLSPAISIEQKSTSHNPRSTVGTVTEIHDYLRLLFARVGTPQCPDHHVVLNARTVSEMVDQVLTLPPGSRLLLLAPVVAERKGEHQHALQDMKAQGFVRARIDGTVVDLDNPPALDSKKAHTIEAVVDRFKVRDDLASRLADSFETALGLGEGIARIAWMEDPAADDIVFSARYACPECGYALEELEPRLFSFNNPRGACPGCDGLGVQEFFDPELVVGNPELSLAGGAIRGWDRRNAYYSQLMESLAAHYDFSAETAFADLPEEIRNIILYGSGSETIAFRYMTPQGGTRKQTHAFEGVISNMARRYRETDSGIVREELARYRSTRQCVECAGGRLNRAARNVLVAGHSLPELAALSVTQCRAFFESLTMDGSRGEITAPIRREIAERLSFLNDVGLNYLSLDRSAASLSGGEAQRIRLASQIGAGLVGVMYVLDEPSIGLHQRDNARLLATLGRLRDLGNTVIVVEHDEEAIRGADDVVDLGPGPGRHGGRIVAHGPPQRIADTPDSLTGQYLSGKRRIDIPATRMQPDPARHITVRNARGNNLRGLDISIPTGLLTCVTGVSGSGKSTLINETLYPWAARQLNGASNKPAACDGIDGLDGLDKVVDIDQSPIGRTPRSNPATYTGLFTPIRELFAGTPEARARGYQPGRFSFNVKGGRCEACQGEGVTRVEMHFLPDLHVTCDVCKGQRYNRETLEVRYRRLSIHEALELTVEQALDIFHAIPVIRRKLETLMDVGLSYIRLGQSATTLSGGEAQRIKLARELSRREAGRSLYILDEPTTGLHFHDIAQLLSVLQRLRDHGNTVIVIEHNLDVIKTADWVIDLGPEGGGEGGRLIAQGSPEAVSTIAASHTGRFLRQVLPAGTDRRAADG